MANQTYEALYNNFTNNSTKIKFYSGTQANLTKYIKGTYTASDVQPEEGAFYLTTDTQRLYVGRKKTSDNKVYAVQVSKGVTFVTSTNDLPTPNANEVEEGELYYITSQNILAALTYNGSTYEWTQINPATGIKSITTSSTNVPASGTTTDVKLQVTVEPASGSSKSGLIHLKPGANVQIVGSNENSNTEAAATISATDTKYDLTTATNTSAATINLTDNASTPNTDSVTITGSGTVKVTSTNTGAVSVAGPTFENIEVTSASQGFNITLNGTSGDGSSITPSTGSTGGSKLDPTITYGATTGYSAPSPAISTFSAATPVHFVNGNATLDVYTKAQADQAITDAISGALQVADAMTFRGVVKSGAGTGTGQTPSLLSLVTEYGAHNGDVYKVGANADSDSLIVIDGVTADVGDLIIIHGTETNGAVPYTANNLTSLLSICQLVPSGDEPEVQASTTANTTGSASSYSGFQLLDAKNGANTNILTTKFQTTSDGNILLKGSTSNDGKTLTITADHPAISRADATNGDKTNIGLTTHTDANPATSADNDTIGTSKVNLFVLTSPSGLITDSYGHVKGLQGTSIVFEHNKLETLSNTYSTVTTNTTAQAQLSFTDTIGVTKSVVGVKLHSDTLTLSGDDTNKYINLDVTWHTF